MSGSIAAVNIQQNLVIDHVQGDPAWWLGSNSRFRAVMVVTFALNRVLLPNHQGHPVFSNLMK